jgi:3-phenylpropionate/trans-cinnamate dioxygenase ferredoxin subunit
MSRFAKAARLGEIPDGTCKLVEFDDETVALYFVKGAYYAIADVCTHDGGPLADGQVIACQVECPRHGARFDLRTGAATLPALTPVPVYQVRVEGEDVLVEIPDDDW